MEVLTTEMIVTMISSVGFPIVCVVFLFWFIYDTNNKHRQEIADLHNLHNIETSKLAEAINNNTDVMTKLVTMLEMQNKQG